MLTVRVTLVCPYSLSRPGGVQGQVTGLAAALATRGVEVVVVAPVDGRPVSASGGAVVAVGRSVAVPANGSVAPLAIHPRAVAATVGALRRSRPDVVHVHEPLAPLVSWAAMVAPVPGARRVATVHRAGGEGLYRVLGPLARAAMGRFDAVYAVSDAARRTAAPALGDRPCPSVGNGVDVDRFAAVAPAPTEGPTVLFVGRHEPRKGLGVLLQAVSDLGPRWPGRLWVVGEGPQTAQLKQRYAGGPRCRWWGRVGDGELAALLRGADVVCAPSLAGESFGVVLVEAMAAGAVVVCSDIPGYSAVAAGHGIVVPPGDVGALAAALDRVVAAVVAGTGPAAPPALAAAAAHAATFSMAALAERYHRSYDELLGGQLSS